MTVKDSTDYSIQKELVVDLFATELNRFDLGKSIENQFVKTFTLPQSEQREDTILVSEKDFAIERDYSIEESISKLTKAKKLYGFYRDSIKYSGKTQRWEGHVLEIHDDKFSAKLEDITNPGTYEIINFGLDDVSPEDSSLLSPGSIFYFSIGYTTTSGTVEKTSLLRFKRVADWTVSELDRAADRADRLFNNLKWE